MHDLIRQLSGPGISPQLESEARTDPDQLKHGRAHEYTYGAYLNGRMHAAGCCDGRGSGGTHAWLRLREGRAGPAQGSPRSWPLLPQGPRSEPGHPADGR